MPALVGAFAPPIMVAFFRNHRKEMEEMGIMVAIATMMPMLSERTKEEEPDTGRAGGANASLKASPGITREGVGGVATSIAY